MRQALRSEQRGVAVYCNKHTFYYFVKISTRIAGFNSHVNQFNDHAFCIAPLRPPPHTHIRTHSPDGDLIKNLNTRRSPYW